MVWLKKPKKTAPAKQPTVPVDGFGVGFELPLKISNEKTKKEQEAACLKWFFDLAPPHFVFLCKEWNERSFKIQISDHDGYDQWLNYFKTLTPTAIKQLAQTGVDFLPTEAYAALSRWHDIIKSPGRIDKIHQAGLTSQGSKTETSITQLAASNDRLGVLRATRDKIAEKLEKGAGARDTAALAREMTDIMGQIAEYERRLGPKRETKLGQLLGEFDVKQHKRPARNGGGARNTSFKSRVTIDDVEGAE